MWFEEAAHCHSPLTRLLTGLYEGEWGRVVVVLTNLAVTVVKYESGSFPAIVCLIVCISLVDIASHVVSTFSPNSCVICLVLSQMSVVFQVELTYFLTFSAWLMHSIVFLLPALIIIQLLSYWKQKSQLGMVECIGQTLSPSLLCLISCFLKTHNAFIV